MPDRARLGTVAGVTSGLLGALSVLGALCFLLPDWLVAEQALPLYRAHLGWFRGLLQASIFLTFALGAASVVILRSQKHGLAGLALAVVALSMGGSQAEPLTTGRRAVSAGLDYFVLELLVLGALFVPLEVLFPIRPERTFRGGWQTDLKHFFVSHAAVQLISFASIVPVELLFAWAARAEFQGRVAAQPLWLQFAEILFAIDLATYWVHRAFHVVPRLWNFHAIHHSSLTLDWLAGSRMHVVDILVTRAAGFLPVLLLGFAPAAVYAYLVFVSFHAVYIHSNIRWRWPLVRWMIATPEFHHWHHTSDEEGIDKNFAAFLPLLDVAFGTAHLPGKWPRKYGTVKFQPPETYLGQLAYPFRRRGESTPYG